MRPTLAELLSYEGCTKFIQRLLERDLFSQLSAQEVKFLMWLLARQVIENRGSIIVTVGELEAKLAISSKTIHKILENLVAHNMLHQQNVSSSTHQRAARPLRLSINLRGLDDWPEIDIQEQKRLIGPSLDKILEQDFPEKGFCDGKYV